MAENNPVLSTIATGAKFHINGTKLYVPMFTFSINNCIEFLENMKQGFKRRVSWNKYRSEITWEPKNDNLIYMIEPIFRNINRMFVLSFKLVSTVNQEIDKYFMPLLEIKDFNALAENKPIFFLINLWKTND